MQCGKTNKLSKVSS